MKPFLLLLLLLFGVENLRGQQNVRVLVVTGGHDFEEDPFFDVFNSVENINYTHLEQPKANKTIASDKVNRYDVLVFYDMYDQITGEQKNAYKELLEEGKGMIFLHHALVSYQEWDEFKKIIGGKYHRKETQVNGKTYKSDFSHDEIIHVKVEQEQHPILKGVTHFTINDEIYGNCEILDSVEPLLTTSHPQSMNPVAWINPYGKSEVIFIQFGHGPSAYSDENFKKILKQAIHWSANRH